MGVGAQDIVAAEVDRDLVCQGFQAIDHAAFPVDQRAVNIKR